MRSYIRKVSGYADYILRRAVTPWYVAQRSRAGRFDAAESSQFRRLKANTLRFVESVRVDEGAYRHLYAPSCVKPTLYASAYACMTRSILRDLDGLSDQEKQRWAQYFDSFQQPDGLFHDPVVANDAYADSDWWGARHVSLHMVSAYAALERRPKYAFGFLRQYYGAGAALKLLDGVDWQSASIGDTDIDNKIMNIGCLLQYQRDVWHDLDARASIEELKCSLRERIMPETGMWGGFDPRNKHELSRMVQFAYHLYPLFFFDEDFEFDAERIVSLVLDTQNEYGGYGVRVNSSACEDMDSIYILIQFYRYLGGQTQERVRASLRKALSWVLLNEVDTGGFVFRLNEKFQYGSEYTRSLPQEAGCMPTWFRVLSIAYLARFFAVDDQFKITPVPGYEF